MEPDQQAIRELAYRLWEQRGRRDGGADEDWRAAEQQLRAQGEQEPASPEAIKLLPSEESIASAVPNKPPENVQVQLDEVNAAYGRKRPAPRTPTAAHDAPGSAPKKPRTTKPPRA